MAIEWLWNDDEWTLDPQDGLPAFRPAYDVSAAGMSVVMRVAYERGYDRGIAEERARFVAMLSARIAEYHGEARKAPDPTRWPE